MWGSRPNGAENLFTTLFTFRAKIKSEENFEERPHHYSLSAFLHYLYFFLEK
jgi:hypothetical protein